MLHVQWSTLPGSLVVMCTLLSIWWKHSTKSQRDKGINIWAHITVPLCIWKRQKQKSVNAESPTFHSRLCQSVMLHITTRCPHSPLTNTTSLQEEHSWKGSTSDIRAVLEQTTKLCRMCYLRMSNEFMVLYKCLSWLSFCCPLWMHSQIYLGACETLSHLLRHFVGGFSVILAWSFRSPIRNQRI